MHDHSITHSRSCAKHARVTHMKALPSHASGVDMSETLQDLDKARQELDEAMREEASSRTAADAALRDSAQQAESELSNKLSELEAKVKEDRDAADSVLAKRIEEFDGVVKVQGERLDGEMKRVDELEAKGRAMEESMSQEKEERIAVDTREKQNHDAVVAAAAVLGTRIDELEAKERDLLSGAQRSDADAAEKIAALQGNQKILEKMLEDSKTELSAKLASEAEKAGVISAAKLKEMQRDMSLEIHDKQKELLDKLATDKGELHELLGASKSALETKLDAVSSELQKQEGNLQALETRLNEKSEADTAAKLKALQRDVSLEIHDKHAELLKIVETNKGELEEKLGAEQGEWKEKQQEQQGELQALEARLNAKIDSGSATASADVGAKADRLGERVEELGKKVEEHGTKIAELDEGKASAGKVESDMHEVSLLRDRLVTIEDKTAGLDTLSQKVEALDAKIGDVEESKASAGKLEAEMHEVSLLRDRVVKIEGMPFPFPSSPSPRALCFPPPPPPALTLQNDA